MSMQSIVAYVLVMIAAYFLIKKLFFSKKKEVVANTIVNATKLVLITKKNFAKAVKLWQSFLFNR